MFRFCGWYTGNHHLVNKPCSQTGHCKSAFVSQNLLPTPHADVLHTAEQMRQLEGSCSLPGPATTNLVSSAVAAAHARVPLGQTTPHSHFVFSFDTHTTYTHGPNTHPHSPILQIAEQMRQLQGSCSLSEPAPTNVVSSAVAAANASITPGVNPGEEVDGGFTLSGEQREVVDAVISVRDTLCLSLCVYVHAYVFAVLACSLRSI